MEKFSRGETSTFNDSNTSSSTRPQGNSNNFQTRSDSQIEYQNASENSGEINRGAVRKPNNYFNRKPKIKYRYNNKFKQEDTNYAVGDFNHLKLLHNNEQPAEVSISSSNSQTLVNNTRQYHGHRNFKPFHKINNNSNYYGNNSFRNYRQTFYENSKVFQDNESRDQMYKEHRQNLGKNQFYKNKQVKYNKNWKHNKNGKFSKKIDIASQRERLEEMIKGKILECLVCCDLFKYTDKIWSCKQCYHIFHLKCTQEWANTSQVDKGWRCPACQNVCKEIPCDYRCFCDKVKDPKNEPGLIPHSCGDICLREGRNCEHRCLILCHPGPCPECAVMVKKLCGCGKTVQQVKCSSDIEIICSNVCEKLLECGLHQCKEKCHIEECKPCIEILEQNCFCGKDNRKVSCTSEYNGQKNYSCENICDKMLSCGNHKCLKKCHDGQCEICIKDVEVIKTCHCGKTPLREDRVSCLDPIPSCEKVCDKMLKCGPPNLPHMCKSLCHEGDCPYCDLTTMLKCRCGFMDKEIPCEKLTTKADDARCEKKCVKKRLCGKHKCNQRCCIEIEHVCPLPCNHLLSCGNHRCGLTCHSGRCKSCMETSFEELYCECGFSVIYPPVPCGTKPPICNKPCTRQRNCGHDVNHTCHIGPCPPCTLLCKQWCYGKHEQRGTIPCHQESFSCGLSCGKPMPCGRHKCNKPCHLGSCPVPCKQPCIFERPLCGHPCNAPCHKQPCPETNCKSKVSVSCTCGVQKGQKSCNEVIDEFKNIEMALLSEKMMNMSKNQVVDISDINIKPKRPDVLKILECNEECRIMERNRRLAIGLQIRNPDISQKLTPRYSEFMRGWAKKDPHFCQRVHEKLTELVQLAKQSKQRSRSFSFESMNRDKRHFIHEYCEHFGCDSAAYDAEPNRNIVATATRDKSWLPSMSLLEVIQRENGQRKVPGPSVLDRSTCSKSESFPLKPLGRTLKLNMQFNDDSVRK